MPRLNTIALREGLTLSDESDTGDAPFSAIVLVGLDTDGRPIYLCLSGDTLRALHEFIGAVLQGAERIVR